MNECNVYKQAKLERVVYPSFLQPLPTLEGTCRNIIMDFIKGLPYSKGNDTVMVIVERFIKYGYFIVLTHFFTAQGVAQMFLDHLYKFYELPTTIIINKDKNFTNLLWKKLLGVKLLMSSYYHQIDGQIEMSNQYLKTYLRCMAMHNPKKWLHWLSLVQ